MVTTCHCDALVMVHFHVVIIEGASEGDLVRRTEMNKTGYNWVVGGARTLTFAPYLR